MLRTHRRATVARPERDDVYPDVLIVRESDGTALVQAATLKGREWICDNLHGFDEVAANRRLVEPEYLYDVVDSLFDAGLIVR